MKRHFDKYISVVHEGKKPFKYDLCDSNFIRKTAINSHVTRIREGKRPFTYEICENKFVDVNGLKTHIKFLMQANAIQMHYA